MKTPLFLFSLLLSFFSLSSQNSSPEVYCQIKLDFLEPVVNQGFIARADLGFGRQLAGVFAGGAGKVSEFDNAQFETFEDKTVFLCGLEYQYFLRKKRVNSGFYVGGDVMYANRTVSSKVSDESVNGISVFTPGLWFGWTWLPFKNDHFLVDLTIIHPRYDFGRIKKVDFQSVEAAYEPENLLNFLGPWSVGWRF
jgi:hypothetical protein